MKPKANERQAAETPDEQRSDNVLRFVTRAELERGAKRAGRKAQSAARDADPDDDPDPPAA